MIKYFKIIEYIKLETCLRKNNFIYVMKKKYTNEILHKIKRKQKKGDFKK